MNLKRTILLGLSLVFLCGCLCGCGQLGGAPIVRQPDNTEAMRQVWLEASHIHFPELTAEHGEDYPIAWEDPGMEAYIRAILDRPSGDILHSEVWDIKVLAISGDVENAQGTLIEALPEGYTEFSQESIFSHRRNSRTIYNESFPAIKSLTDLRHFDSLQMFSLNYGQKERELTDLSGPEQCKNLKVLQLQFARPETLAPVSQMTALEFLWLGQCGDLDLEPLTGLPMLSRVTLFECRLASLEPLATLPKLFYLNLGSDATYPSLEPLTRSSVEYLDLGASARVGKRYRDLDYEPLGRIPNLVYLNLCNHPDLDVDTCNTILDNAKKLKYLDISLTKVAKKGDQLHTQDLTLLLGV